MKLVMFFELPGILRGAGSPAPARVGAVVLAAIMSVGAPALALPQRFAPSGGAVEMMATGKPTFLRIRGKGAAPTGTLSVDAGTVTGAVEFDLNTLDTGIGLRDEHMRNKYLEVGTHPRARLELDPLKLTDGWSVSSPKIDGPFTGKLTLHGETQPVSGHFTVGNGLSVQAEFKILLSDYKVAIPQYAGIKVANEVELKVSIDSLVAK